LIARHNVEAGYSTWRYILNASFPNTQAFPAGGAYHGTQIQLVRGTYPAVGLTAQEFALSNYMQAAWAGFAKNPLLGPGWNQVGSFGGVDVGVLGEDGSGGVTVVDAKEVDGRCGLYARAYERMRVFR